MVALLIKAIYRVLLVMLLLVPFAAAHAQSLNTAPRLTKTIFTQTQQLGAVGDQVRGLQELLKQFPGIYPEGIITGHFGPLTESAVRRFQTQQSIDSVGIVGPKTMVRLNQLGMGGGIIGSTGATGARGSSGGGSTGATGSTGGIGATGASGIDGSIGATGSAGATGTTGNTGAAGTNGTNGSAGATGSIGATGTAGSTGSTGATGTTGNTGAAGTNGTNGTNGSAGATGSIGATGTAGSTGATGTTGNTGAAGTNGTNGSAGATGATGSIGNTGTSGATGTVGATGPTGATGPAGPAGGSGVVSSAQYVRFGSQPATVAAGIPFIFSMSVLTTPGITTSDGIHFTLASTGRYEINYQMSYAEDGAVVLYLGQTAGTMTSLPYTMTGKATPGAIAGSVIIETTAVNSVVSLNAAPGNAGVITVPPNSSTTNQSATTISFKKISD